MYYRRTFNNFTGQLNRCEFSFIKCDLIIFKLLQVLYIVVTLAGLWSSLSLSTNIIPALSMHMSNNKRRRKILKPNKKKMFNIRKKKFLPAVEDYYNNCERMCMYTYTLLARLLLGWNSIYEKGCSIILRMSSKREGECSANIPRRILASWGQERRGGGVHLS